MGTRNKHYIPRHLLLLLDLHLPLLHLFGLDPVLLWIVHSHTYPLLLQAFFVVPSFSLPAAIFEQLPFLQEYQRLTDHAGSHLGTTLKYSFLSIYLVLRH